MSILSEEITTFEPIRKRYLVGCYINDITEIVGGPDDHPGVIKAKTICRRLCHRIIDEMMEWGCGLIKPEDLRPLVQVYMKNPNDYYIEREDLGRDIYIDVVRKPGIDQKPKHVLKVVLTHKTWCA